MKPDRVALMPNVPQNVTFPRSGSDGEIVPSPTPKTTNRSFAARHPRLAPLLVKTAGGAVTAATYVPFVLTHLVVNPCLAAAAVSPDGSRKLGSSRLVRLSHQTDVPDTLRTKGGLYLLGLHDCFDPADRNVDGAAKHHSHFNQGYTHNPNTREKVILSTALALALPPGPALTAIPAAVNAGHKAKSVVARKFGMTCPNPQQPYQVIEEGPRSSHT